MTPPVIRPLIRSAPRSAMFFPLVVLVAVLPGMVALNSWDLTPPGPLWGLRALAVVDGQVLDQVPASNDIKSPLEAAAFRRIASQPPLFAWLGAIGLKLSADCDPLASVLPSYVAGVLVVILVYLHGRLWRGGGLGFTAALLMGFSPSVLLRVQEATPDTLALAGVFAALLCYGWHVRVVDESIRSWAGPIFWAILGGLTLGISLLSMGLFGMVVVPVVLLHQVYLRSEHHPPASPAMRSRPWWPSWSTRLGLIDGLIALSVALIVALPWHVMMFEVHGGHSLFALAQPTQFWGDSSGLFSRLVRIAPNTLPLGLFGAARAIRLALIDEDNQRETVGGSLWVVWLAVAALLPTFWPACPRGVLDLFLAVPLNLLAASTIADLVNRRVPVRTLIFLAPLTALSVSWWGSEDLRGAVDDLIQGRVDAATALGLHLALDLILASVLITRGLERWARNRDDRQRMVLGSFLLAVLAVTVGTGIREVVFRHGETHDLLILRTMILRRNRDRPFNVVALVNPVGSSSESRPGRPPGTLPGPDGRLRFILRTALPHLPQRELNSVEDLLTLPEGQRLIIIAGPGERLSNAVKSKLGLEAIHPGRSGFLDAYATAHRRSSRR